MSETAYESLQEYLVDPSTEVPGPFELPTIEGYEAAKECARFESHLRPLQRAALNALSEAREFPTQERQQIHPIDRPYQSEEPYDRTTTNLLVSMFPRGGKTELVMADIHRAMHTDEAYKERKPRILVVNDRSDNLRDLRAKFEKRFGDSLNYVSYNDTNAEANDTTADVHFMSRQTLQRLQNRGQEEAKDSHFKDEFDIVVYDEAHHIASNTQRALADYYCPRTAYFLTATPNRLDGLDIRELTGPEVIDISLATAMRLGQVPKLNYHVLQERNFSNVLAHAGLSLKDVADRNEPAMAELVKKSLELMTEQGYNGKQALVFARSIEEAGDIMNILQLQGATAACYHSGMPTKDADAQRALFESKKAQFLITVDKLNEGVDVPDAEVIILARGTRSEGLYRQQIGRGLMPNKDEVLILDWVDNARQLELVDNLVLEASGIERTDAIPELPTANFLPTANGRARLSGIGEYASFSVDAALVDMMVSVRASTRIEARKIEFETLSADQAILYLQSLSLATGKLPSKANIDQAFHMGMGPSWAQVLRSLEGNKPNLNKGKTPDSVSPPVYPEQIYDRDFYNLFYALIVDASLRYPQFAQPETRSIPDRSSLYNVLSPYAQRAVNWRFLSDGSMIVGFAEEDELAVYLMKPYGQILPLVGGLNRDTFSMTQQDLSLFYRGFFDVLAQCKTMVSSQNYPYFAYEGLKNLPAFIDELTLSDVLSTLPRGLYPGGARSAVFPSSANEGEDAHANYIPLADPLRQQLLLRHLSADLLARHTHTESTENGHELTLQFNGGMVAIQSHLSGEDAGSTHLFLSDGTRATLTAEGINDEEIVGILTAQLLAVRKAEEMHLVMQPARNVPAPEHAIYLLDKLSPENWQEELNLLRAEADEAHGKVIESLAPITMGDFTHRATAQFTGSGVSVVERSDSYIIRDSKGGLDGTSWYIPKQRGAETPFAYRYVHENSAVRAQIQLRRVLADVEPDDLVPVYHFTPEGQHISRLAQLVSFTTPEERIASAVPDVKTVKTLDYVFRTLRQSVFLVAEEIDQIQFEMEHDGAVVPTRFWFPVGSRAIGVSHLIGDEWKHQRYMFRLPVANPQNGRSSSVKYVEVTEVEDDLTTELSEPRDVEIKSPEGRAINTRLSRVAVKYEHWLAQIRAVRFRLTNGDLLPEGYSVETRLDDEELTIQFGTPGSEVNVHLPNPNYTVLDHSNAYVEDASGNTRPLRFEEPVIRSLLDL